MNLKVISTTNHDDLSHIYGLFYCRIYGASENKMIG